MDRAAVERAKELFRTRMPGFRTFSDAGENFVRREDTYKRDASREARVRLTAYVNGSSRLAGDAEARKLANEIIELTNFTNWRDRAYINEELLAGEGSWLRFMDGIVQCLRESPEGAWRDRLATLLALLEELDCAGNISKILPTYFLFLWDPAHHVCIKVSLFNRFFELIGEARDAKGARLTVEEYERSLRICAALREELSDLAPRDYIDIQSFIWVVAASRRAGRRRVRRPSLRRQGALKQRPLGLRQGAQICRSISSCTGRPEPARLTASSGRLPLSSRR
jgi:hypothetical protein